MATMMGEMEGDKSNPYGPPAFYLFFMDIMRIKMWALRLFIYLCFPPKSSPSRSTKTDTNESANTPHRLPYALIKKKPKMKATNQIQTNPGLYLI
jgi:hypothetical protein